MMGRLTRDPEIRYTNSGKTIGSFSIAVERRFKSEGQPEADFFNCTTFGKQAEFVEKYLKKGTKIVLSGEIQNNNYKDKNGNQQYSVQIMVNELEFAESKKAQTENNAEADNGFINVPEGLEEELPFN
jgi:single-strand DNA-binding protein